MTFIIRNGSSETHVSYSAPPTRIEAHNGNPQYIIRMPDGRHVSANADGQPLLDAQGHMETWGGSDHMTPEQSRAVWRGTDPHVTHTPAPTADETATIREQLRARGFTNV
jgi:hypothetical protein